MMAKSFANIMVCADIPRANAPPLCTQIPYTLALYNCCTFHWIAYSICYSCYSCYSCNKCIWSKNILNVIIEYELSFKFLNMFIERYCMLWMFLDLFDIVFNLVDPWLMLVYFFAESFSTLIVMWFIIFYWFLIIMLLLTGEANNVCNVVSCSKCSFKKILLSCMCTN